MTPDTAAAGRECEHCEATGKLLRRAEGARSPDDYLRCPTCKGTGRLPTDDNPAGREYNCPNKCDQASDHSNLPHPDCEACHGTGFFPATDDNHAGDGIGEYYARKERERKAAWDHREKVKAKLARAREMGHEIEDLLRELRSAERAYELAAYVGD